MTGAPELERPNGSDQDVKHKRSWTNNGRCYSEQRHDCDVTRRTCMAYRRVKECDHPDGEKNKNGAVSPHSAVPFDDKPLPLWISRVNVVGDVERYFCRARACASGAHEPA